MLIGYTQLAGIHDVITNVLSLPPRETEPKINALLQKALEIDDQYGHIYTLLGMRKIFECDWKSAETNLKRAIVLNPGHPLTHIGYSHYLTAVGRINDGIVAAKCAVELDPLSGAYNFWLAISLSYEKQYLKQ